VYYKDSNGCLILFDLSNKATFNNAIKWKSDVDLLCTGPGGRKLPCILIANKVCSEFLMSSSFPLSVQPNCYHILQILFSSAILLDIGPTEIFNYTSVDN
jgi:GTPase SAR1 family protein